MSEIILVMKYVGIPYKHMGRDENGLDCWGLILLIYRQLLGINLWDIDEQYTDDWSWQGKDLFMQNYQKQWEKASVPKTFDIVLINNGKDIANHAGVMVSRESFLHCIKSGVVLSRITDRIWKLRIAGYFRYKNDKT